MPLAKEVCFGSANDSFGNFTVNYPGYKIWGVRLVHISGGVTCYFGWPKTKFGCHGYDLSVFVVDVQKTVLWPADEFKTVSCTTIETFYSYPPYNANSNELVLFRKEAVIISTEKELRLYYGEDMYNEYNAHDNAGASCVSVYGCLCESEACTECECAPGFTAKNGICETVNLWTPIAENVLFGARVGEEGNFILPFTAFIKGVKVVHRSGGFLCSDDPTVADGFSNFGCNGKEEKFYGKDKVAVWLTRPDKTALWPRNDFPNSSGFYALPPYNAHSKEIEIFGDNWLFQRNGTQLIISYGEAWAEEYAADNSGTAYVDIYGCMCKEEGPCNEACECLPGFVPAENYTCLPEWEECSVTCGEGLQKHVLNETKTRPCQADVPCPIWMPLVERVCFGARNDHFGNISINNHTAGYLRGIRLVHLSGGVTCSHRLPLTHFGCKNSDNLSVFITSKDRNVVYFPQSYTGTSYTVDSYGPNSNELVLFRQDAIFVHENLFLWYGEDYRDASEHDNNGTVCVQVFGCMCKEEGTCNEACECLPGFVLGENFTCAPNDVTIWSECSVTCGEGLQINQIQQTRNCSTNVTCPVWMPLAKNVCFGSANDRFGNFTVNNPGFMWSVRLVHVSGGVTCKPELTKTKFGCGVKVKWGRLSTFIVASNNISLVYWPDLSYIRQLKAEFYNLTSYGSNSSEIVLYRYKEPIAVVQLQEMRVYYGQDLFDYSEDNNDGFSCIDVYGLLCESETKLDECNCYPGFVVGDNNTCVPETWTECSVTCGEGIQMNQIQQTRNCSTNVTCPDLCDRLLDECECIKKPFACPKIDECANNTNYQKACDVLISNETLITKNNLITVIPQLWQDMSVMFDVSISSYRTWFTSVLHLTLGEDYGKYGDRITTVFINGPLKLFHVTSAVSGNINEVYDTKPFELNAWHEFRIGYETINSINYYTIDLNEQLLLNVTNNVSTTFNNVSVYAGDSQEADGLIRNLVLTMPLKAVCLCKENGVCDVNAECICNSGYVYNNHTCVREIWTECSVTCGEGIQKNQDNQTRNCSANVTCPVLGEAKWGSWSSWSECSATCDRGTKQKTRKCYPSTKGEFCAVDAYNETQMKHCDTYVTCPSFQFANVSVNCIETCEKIELKCTSIDNHEDLFNGQHGSPTKVVVESWLKNNANCSGFHSDLLIPGYFEDSMKCYADDADYSCFDKGPKNFRRLCNCQPYDEIVMGEWSSWGECIEPCDWGIRSRSRESVSVENVLSYKHSEPCKIKECGVSGLWSDWGSWSVCSKTCGNGVRSRSRLCDNPPPAYGGLDCPGINNQTEYCGTTAVCPVNGGWSSWSEPTKCNKPCGNGTTKSVRDCNNPTPEFGGKNCEGESVNLTSCNMHECAEVELNVAVEFTDEEYMLQYENVNSEPSKALRDKIEDRMKKMYAQRNIGTNFRVIIHEIKDPD